LGRTLAIAAPGNKTSKAAVWGCRVPNHTDDEAPKTETEERADVPIPDWNDFRVFLTAVRAGSFSRAAEELGTTQPTVSRAVARLEAVLQTQLVDRTNNGVTLTLEGQRIMEELNVAHDALQRAVRRTRSHGQRRYDVKLATTDGLASYWLSRFLAPFFDQNPDIGLRISTINDRVIDRRNPFDLLVHYLPHKDVELRTARLGTLHFIPYASPGYLRKFGRPTSLDDFRSHRLTDMALYIVDKGSWITRLPEGMALAQTQLLSDSSPMLAEAVRNGAGIGLVPTYASVFEQDLEPLEGLLHLEAAFWLCYRQEAAGNPAVQATIRFLRHVFDRKTMPWFADHYVPPSEFPATSVEKILRTYHKEVPDLTGKA
jgi:DNA-binding transcriptional LysR family regulator